MSALILLTMPMETATTRPAVLPTPKRCGRVNEYLRRAAAHRFRWSAWNRRARDRLVTTYAWAIPNAKALRTLARYAPLVEIGAGSGYWAHLLGEMGVNILAFDQEPPDHPEHDNGYFRCEREGVPGKTWTRVRRGGSWVAGIYPERTLFLCWPPFRTSMAYDALQSYTAAGGKTVIYVGEWGGCTADEAFEQQLEDHYECIERVSVPRWDSMHDDLSVWHVKDNAQA